MHSFFNAMENWFAKLLALSILMGVYGCSTTPEKPDTESEKYKQAVSNFYVSLAAIQSDQVPFAVEKMEKVGESYPDEPAVWANLGVFAMRQGNFERATKQLDKAIEQAPDGLTLFSWWKVARVMLKPHLSICVRQLKWIHLMRGYCLL